MNATAVCDAKLTVVRARSGQVGAYFVQLGGKFVQQFLPPFD